MSSIFSKIIAGEIPCYKIAENKHCIAFLDINPLKEGHCLVVPKKEVDDLFDLDEETYTHLLSFTKKVATAAKAVLPCRRISVIVLGFEVPHAHIHLIPINNEAEANFKNPKLKFTKEEFEATRKKISQSFEGLFPGSV
ncbi:MAG TPA: HIT family protein [Bacteroidia bacterium]|jgi:histidine triad (HIT) family protein|nr:HIT family protein [Bacteroidia bacterium]